jgi:hypothetical protein
MTPPNIHGLSIDDEHTITAALIYADMSRSKWTVRHYQHVHQSKYPIIID